MTNQPIPRVGTKSKCRHCGEEIIYEPWFRDGRGPNPPIWAHTKGPRTCGTRPKGWRRDSWPFAEPEPEEADSHICGNCDGVDPDTCLGNPDRPAEPAGLRDLYAAAIASYDHAVGQATDPAPRGHHYGQADAVLAVRDRELEQLRAEAAEQESTQATPHELESRQRRAWNAAGHCPMCNTDNTGGWLCDDCMTTVRSLPARKRRGWRRYEPPAAGTPIQGHGYTPAGLLGLTDDEPPTA